MNLFYLNRHTPSGQSRVYRIMQLRTDGVHCLESAGAGPVALKVFPAKGATFSSPWSNSCAPLFSHTHYWYEVDILKVSGAVKPEKAAPPVTGTTLRTTGPVPADSRQ